MIHKILQPFLGVFLFLFSSFSLPFSHFSAPEVKPAGAVIDGGDIGAAAVVGRLFNVDKNWYKDQTCVCHQLNNIIKKILSKPRNPTPTKKKGQEEKWKSQTESDDEISESQSEEMLVETNKPNASINTPKAQQKPNILEDFLIPLRRFIKALRHSHPMREAWLQNCTNLLGKPVELQPDVATRWSSSVEMLRKAFKLKTAIQMFFLVVNRDQVVCSSFLLPPFSFLLPI
jgi:hypothetical protein